MANKKKDTTLSPIQQFITYAAQKEDKSTLSLPISESDNVDIEIKYLLNADEMVSFVTNVTKALFVNDTYLPFLYDLVLAKAIIVYYTNLKEDISNETLTSLVFNTNIVEKIKAEVNYSQMKYILNAIDKNIEFKKQEVLNTHAVRLDKAIHQIEFLTEATTKITEQFSNIDLKEATDATIKFSRLSESDMVNNILEVKFGENTSTDNTKA